MEEKLNELLRSINNGKINGAKIKLAKKLNVSSASISQWIAHKTEPSSENIDKMAKLFNVPAQTIQKIFIQNSNISNNNISNSFNSATDKENELLRKEIELKNKEIELLKKEMELNKRGR